MITPYGTMRLLSSSDADLRHAAQALRAGLLVAFPTETVYGLGGDAFNPQALAKIFEAKRRPFFDPLIIHIASVDMLLVIANLKALSPSSREKVAILGKHLWPGPLTIVLPKQSAVPDLATSGLATLAVRLPSHESAQKLIRYAGGAIAAPSANRFGCLSPTRAEHVRDQLGDRVDFIIDGGCATVGVESTIIDLSTEAVRLLRPGGVPRETIEALIGEVSTEVPPTNAPSAPGQLKSHYAPRTPLLLHPREAMLTLPAAPNSAYLFFDGSTRDRWGRHEQNVWVLSHSGNALEAAANLFDFLYRIDKTGASIIHAQQAPSAGLGIAINDRLSRAASCAT
jgi:L-threonylcarbamoyladenylate synthase